MGPQDSEFFEKAFWARPLKRGACSMTDLEFPDLKK